MHQSMVPAFSQLLAPDKREQLNQLFSRAMRLNIVGVLPAVATLFVVARPLLTILAGEEFGRESTVPFYILLAGLLFNLTSYIPASIMIAIGRTDYFGKVYWVEIFPYIILIAILTTYLGAVGAALGWTIRILIDTCLLSYFSQRLGGVSLHVFRNRITILWAALLLLLPPVVIAALSSETIVTWSLALLPFSLVSYSIIAWIYFLRSEEKDWAVSKMKLLLQYQSKH
jgi:O-antigen/teichoic acid export membrane protein